MARGWEGSCAGVALGGRAVEVGSTAVGVGGLGGTTSIVPSWVWQVQDLPGAVGDLDEIKREGRLAERQALHLDRDHHPISADGGSGIDLGDDILEGAGLVIRRVEDQKIRLGEGARDHLGAIFGGVRIDHLDRLGVEAGAAIDAVDIRRIFQHDIERLHLSQAYLEGQGVRVDQGAAGLGLHGGGAGQQA